MRKLLVVIPILVIGAVACSEDPKKEVSTDKVETIDTTNVANNREDIIKEKLKNVEIEGNVYNEYYPNSKKIKFQGPQDENGERHGKWLYFSEDGIELSMTMYIHGQKHGHSIVKYPNGAMHYVGEYKNNKPVGVWKTYTSKGELSQEKDYGQPDDTAEK